MTDDIIIIGGGTGGAVLANDLAERLGREIDAGEVRVRLLNDGPDHVYKPVWLYVPFGKREPADGRRPLRELIDSRIEIEDTRVTEIDTDGKRLRTTTDSTPISYDHLVVGTGSTLAADEIPGLQAGGHDFYSEDGSLALREELLSFTEGHLVLSVIGSPHMCPAAPLEFSFMTDDWFRKRGLREDIEITYTYPDRRMGPAAARRTRHHH